MAPKFDFTLPGLGKPASSRPQRVGEAIKHELTLLLLRDAGDPRLAGVSISQVTVTSDLKLAKIYFTVPPGVDHNPAQKGMNRAKGYFRSHLAKVLNLRYTPDLLFYFDSFNEETERIEKLFRQIHEEQNHEQS